MFFMMVLYTSIVILFVWLMWRLVIKPVLISKGVEVEDEKVIITKYTKDLDKMRKEYVEKLTSATSVKETKELNKRIREMDVMIKECEESMEEC